MQRVVWAGGAEPVLLRLSEDPRLVEPALDLLGTNHCEQLLCQAHYKMPNDGVAFDWHQDIQHRDKGGDTWRDVTGRGSYVQTILLVDDMTEENGPLEFAPEGRRHARRGRSAPEGRRLRCTSTRRAPSRSPGVRATCSSSVPYAVHGSTPNQSREATPRAHQRLRRAGANKRLYPGRGACRVLPARPATGRAREIGAEHQGVLHPR